MEERVGTFRNGNKLGRFRVLKRNLESKERTERKKNRSFCEDGEERRLGFREGQCY